MATAARATTYPHIRQIAEVCGGQPTIDDTRVRVKNIVALLKEGKNAEEMIAEYPSLNLAQVYAALAYYYDNPDEIEASLQEELEYEARHEQMRAESLARRTPK